MNRNYELVVILDPELKAEEQEKLLSKIKKQIAEAEGAIAEAKELGKKELAYPIRKKKAGIFYVFNFSLTSEKAASLEQKLRMEEQVLRFLLVVKETPLDKKEGDKGGK